MAKMETRRETHGQAQVETERAGEMAQKRRCLLCKQEDLNLNPQVPHDIYNVAFRC